VYTSQINKLILKQTNAWGRRYPWATLLALRNIQMRASLKRHPGCRSSAVTNIEVDIARPNADSLVLSYGLTGKLRDVLMPPVIAPTPCHALWKHTCFEAFVCASGNSVYYEFNFAPSSQWAAYRFNSYRNGMSVAMDVGAPIIETKSSPDRYTLQATLGLDRLSELPRGAAWHLGLSAVIEEADHRISYWALTHPPGKPDFHRADCFIHELSPAVVS
jgi:hypothetical protein